MTLAIFLFYNQARGKQDRYAFSKHFRHLDTYVYSGDRWVLFRFGSAGIEYAISKFKTGAEIITKLSKIPSMFRIIALNIDKRSKFQWRPLWGRTCNELARYLTAIDIGTTYSPRHFYSKLLKYDNKRNYQILTIWRRPAWVTGVAITTIQQMN